MSRIEVLIRDLGLEKHPEGGYFRETYRSADLLNVNDLNNRFSDSRNICTAIYYLLSRGEKSLLHRLRSDELWFFHEGQCLDIIVLDKDGSKTFRLGRDIRRGEQLQHIIPAGSWFGALLPPESEYVLCSCTVAPGFDFNDFEMGDRSTLLKKFPPYRHEILTLTNP